MSYCSKQTLAASARLQYTEEQEHSSLPKFRGLTGKQRFLPFHYVQTQFISGEVKKVNLSLNFYSNQGTSLHKQLHPTENFLACTQYSTIILHNRIVVEARGKNLSAPILSTLATDPLPRDLEGGVSSQLFSVLMSKKVSNIKTRQCSVIFFLPHTSYLSRLFFSYLIRQFIKISISRPFPEGNSAELFSKGVHSTAILFFILIFINIVHINHRSLK